MSESTTNPIREWIESIIIDVLDDRELNVEDRLAALEEQVAANEQALDGRDDRVREILEGEAIVKYGGSIGLVQYEGDGADDGAEAEAES